MKFPVNDVVCGDAFEVLKQFPEESVDMVMFSPPYWGLRDYKIPKVDGVFAVGGLGLEEHPKQYVARMIVLGRLLKRVLKKAGSMWLNMGDTYFGGKGQSGRKDHNLEQRKADGRTLQKREWTLNEEDAPQDVCKQDGKWLQPKQKLLIPERVAIALQDDGWILRNDVVWHKPNHMPSSVKDRLTTSWEHLYFFVRSRRYFFDLDAIRQPHKLSSIERAKNPNSSSPKDKIRNYKETSHVAELPIILNPLGKAPDDTVSYEGKFDGFAEESEKYGSPRARNERQIIKEGSHHGSSLSNRAVYYEDAEVKEHPLGKNPDDFWSITTQPFKEAHFAVYPERLCVMPIKAACPQNGTVLDPMCGSGTTLVAARKLCRNYIGIDLNPSYVKMAKKRLAQIPKRIDVEALEQ